MLANPLLAVIETAIAVAPVQCITDPACMADATSSLAASIPNAQIYVLDGERETALQIDDLEVAGRIEMLALNRAGFERVRSTVGVAPCIVVIPETSAVNKAELLNLLACRDGIAGLIFVVTARKFDSEVISIPWSISTKSTAQGFGSKVIAERDLERLLHTLNKLAGAYTEGNSRQISMGDIEQIASAFAKCEPKATFGVVSMLRQGLKRVSTYFRDAGHYLELFVLLEFLRQYHPTSISNEDDFWEWWLFAGISLGFRRDDLSMLPERIIRKNRKARLMWHATHGYLQSVSDIPSQIPLIQSSNYSRQLGLHYGLRGETEIGISFLDHAFALAGEASSVWQRAKIAAAYALVWLSRGKFVEVMGWAKNGLSLLRESKEHVDDLLHYELEALVAYSTLLVRSAGPIQLPHRLIELEADFVAWSRIPHMDFVLGTIADYRLMEGNVEQATRIYNQVFNEGAREAKPSLAPDILKGLLLSGRFNDADALAESVSSAASALGEKARLVAKFARTLVNFHRPNSAVKPKQLRTHLEEIIVRADQTRSFLIGVQASALLHASVVRDAEESDHSYVGRNYLEELNSLSESGWGFVVGSPSEGARLRNEWMTQFPIAQISQAKNTTLVKRGGEERQISPRLAEILHALSIEPKGLSAQQLAVQIYGDQANISTIKAGVSRLRSHIQIASNPYRISEPYQSDVTRVRVTLERGLLREALDLYDGPLLPESVAPMIVEEREAIDSALREGVLGRGDPDLLYEYAQKVPEDLEVWSVLLDALEESDPRRAMAAARVETLEGELAAG